MTNNVEIAPLRSLNDFLLGARFQIPHEKRWSNRLYNNFLYYQTNYFILYGIVFLAVGFTYPAKFICGVLAILSTFNILFHIKTSKKTGTILQVISNHVNVLVILAGSYFVCPPFITFIPGVTLKVLWINFVMYMQESINTFLFAVNVPFLLIFIHASLRMRNLRNKLENTAEFIGMRKTPMGFLLRKNNS